MTHTAYPMDPAELTTAERVDVARDAMPRTERRRLHQQSAAATDLAKRLRALLEDAEKMVADIESADFSADIYDEKSVPSVLGRAHARAEHLAIRLRILVEAR